LLAWNKPCQLLLLLLLLLVSVAPVAEAVVTA